MFERLARFARHRLLASLVLGALAAGSIAAAATNPTMLPNGWRITPPADTTAAASTLPTGIVLSRDGKHAFVLTTGYHKPQLQVLDATTLAPERTVQLGDAFGAPLRDGNGSGVWVANTATFGDQIAHVDALAGRIDRTISLPVPFFASAIARSPDGTLLAVAGDQANRVAFVDVSSGAIARFAAVGRHPAALAFSADGRTLYVAGRAERFIDVVNVADGVVRAHVATGLHPVALARSGNRLFVANSDDDDVATVDLTRDVTIAHAPMPFARRGVVGALPNALALDGDRLYVTCGAANAVAVFSVTDGALAPLGAIPTGWYPTAVAVDRRANAVWIANGKGEGGHANPLYRPGKKDDYTADNQGGSIRRIAMPSVADLRAGLATVASLGAPYAHNPPPPHAVVRARGPIAHVIYVIKENRTYDQVLGDEPAGDGDPSLVMFGKTNTPNQHAIAERFGLFDRFFDDAHVSADGHSWSMAAIANDYLERMWPPNYANRRAFYDFEDGAEAAVPHAGYLWNVARKAGVSFRDYGEFVTAGPNDDGTPTSSMQPDVAVNNDTKFPTFDMNVSDVVRFAEWKREFDLYERTKSLPALEIVRLPRDHTAGTRAGQNTPQAMVADNDRAVGLLVDAVSHSDDWASTAIFILEDDAQDGPDHVDEQRSTLYLISPYAKGGTQHAHYTTSSVLRTIELLLGLPPMTPYDAGARPLSEAFAATPDLRPFAALDAAVNLDAKNAATAYRAGDAARLDFARADAVPEGILNDMLWHATRGEAPRPKVGAFQ